VALTETQTTSLSHVRASAAERRRRTLAADEEQAPEQELDALSLARAKQQSCASGASRF
jgi:hypothetical protein